MLSDEQINKAFEGMNFGPRGALLTARKYLIAKAILKLIAGYSIGNTMACILTELQITTKNYSFPIKRARRWAYDYIFHGTGSV